MLLHRSSISALFFGRDRRRGSFSRKNLLLVLHTRLPRRRRLRRLCSSLPQFSVVRLRPLFFLSREIVISLYHAIIGYLQLGQKEPSAYLPKEKQRIISENKFNKDGNFTCVNLQKLLKIVDISNQQNVIALFCLKKKKLCPDMSSV